MTMAWPTTKAAASEHSQRTAAAISSGLSRGEVASLAGVGIDPAGLRWTPDAISTGPVIVGNARLNQLAANHLGRALYGDADAEPGARPNFRRTCVAEQHRETGDDS